MPVFALLFFILKQTTLWILCQLFIFSGLHKSTQLQTPVGARLLMLARGWLGLLAGSDATCLCVAPARFVLPGPDGGKRGSCPGGDFWVWENTSFPETCCLYASQHCNISLRAPFCGGAGAQGYENHAGWTFTLFCTASALLG